MAIVVVDRLDKLLTGNETMDDGPFALLIDTIVVPSASFFFLLAAAVVVAGAFRFVFPSPTT